MLKTVSSVANALGALNYKGTWNASTNTPTLASGVGTQGDYYVVSVSGATDLDGITNWGVGDWAAFNGSVWQRVEGGADGNFVNLDVTGNATVSGDLTVGSATSQNGVFGAVLGSGGSNEGVVVVSGAAGTGWLGFNNANNASIPGQVTYNHSTNLLSLYSSGAISLTGAATFSDNIIIGTSGKGIDFSATAGTGTSEVFDDYEEGVFSPVVAGITTAGTYSYTKQVGTYTKVGNSVRVSISLEGITADSAGSGTLKITGLPFSADGTHISTVYARSLNFDNTAAYLVGYTDGTLIYIREIIDNSAGAGVNVADISSGNTRLYFSFFYKV